MYPDIVWAADVLPEIQNFLSQSMVKGTMITVMSISIGAMAARKFFGVFMKRDD